MKSIFIIEHLEPELFEWCLIEYKEISKIVGKENLWFTNIRKKDFGRLENYGRVFEKSVKSMEIKSTCVLDPEASETLNPSETKDFEYYIFGGILGDNPPRKRTQEELTPFIKNSEKRNIGKAQLSTDNAVYVVSEIVKGRDLEKIDFVDGVEIKIDDIFSVGLPFSYPVVNGKARISKELVDFIKKTERER